MKHLEQELRRHAHKVLGLKGKKLEEHVREELRVAGSYPHTEVVEEESKKKSKKK